MADPTPGPWYIESLPTAVLVGKDGRRIAKVGPAPGQGMLSDTDEANARRIAAAPNMEAALEKFLENKYGYPSAETIRMGEEALAKARGEGA